MKTTPFLSSLAASASLIGSSSAALLQVDFNDKAAEITPSGWEAFSSTTDPNNKTQAFSGYDDLAGIGNDVSITSAGIEFSRDAGLPSGTGLDDMFRDLVFRNDDGNVITVTISGLLAGTYEMRTYHHVEAASGGSERTSFDLDVEDADSPSFGQAVGNFTMGGEGVPTDSGVFTISSNGTDDVVLRFTQTASGGLGGRDWWGINGLELTDGSLDDDDGDNLPDSWELSFPSVTSLADLDGTLAAGSGPGSGTGDFDGDGLSDFDEFDNNSDPTKTDTDGDTLSDNDEVNGTNGFFTEPGLADTDGDGLSDFVEPDLADGYATNPLLPDTDGDTMTDGYEQANNAIAPGLDPTDPADGDEPANGPEDDLDGDGLSNLAEFEPTLGPNSSSPQTRADNPDTDNDGYTDDVEDNLGSWASATFTGSDPTNPDHDGDGLVDGDENPDTGTAAGTPYNSDPTRADTDGDGDGDGAEVAGGSDPADFDSNIDSDGDGYTNSAEIAAGTLPNDGSSFPQPAANALWLDFNSLVNVNGQPGYESYDANNEAPGDFVRMTYPAFGSTVGVTPSWPDTTDPRVMQMQDRSDTEAVLWSGDLRPFLRDWIGVDSRSNSGGNGAYDGTTGTPTRLVLTLDGLPADTYAWRSFHHDVEKMHGKFAVEVSTDGGANYTPVAGPLPDGTFQLTNSAPDSTPPAATLYTGFPNPGSVDPADLPSTIDLMFTADGINDVLVRFTPITTTQTHRSFFCLNGFQLTGNMAISQPVVITHAAFDGSGNFVLDFKGGANTDYETMKSVNLSPGSFSALGTPLIVTTDGSGIGQAVVPAVEANDSAAFYRIEER